MQASATDVLTDRMPLYWLCYRHNNQISVVIEPAPSLVHARMRASLKGLDEGTFTEGHGLALLWQIFCGHWIPKSLFL
jgi:hypothetical protein